MIARVFPLAWFAAAVAISNMTTPAASQHQPATRLPSSAFYDETVMMSAESAAAADPPPSFRFAKVVASGMVLQSAPQQAMVWGFCATGATVSISFQNHTIPAIVEVDARAPLNHTTTWRALLPPVEASFDEHSITATSGTVTISLKGVLFGDVWICSGQSNMAYPIGTPTCWNQSNINCTVKDAQCSYGCSNQSGTEIAAMSNYDTSMRLFIVQGVGSKTPQLEMHGSTGWLTPSTMGGQFSAACWFYGRDLYTKLASTSGYTKRPIGLIESNVGGTPDEHWSSPDALHQCMGPHSWNWPTNFTDSVLWNGFMVPLLHTVHSGAIWYQGEANSGKDGRQYNCSFPAMIRDWREKFHEFTDGATSPHFPFGWAQLNSNGPIASNYKNPALSSKPLGAFDEWGIGFPSIRLAQTTTLSSLINTFQAVILDTPVASGSIHSPYKQPCGQRLARGGLSVAYGMDSVASVNPVPSSVRTSTTSSGATTIIITLSGLGTRGVETRVGGVGLEVLDGDSHIWHSAPIMSSDHNSVTFGPAPTGALLAVRYLWYASPCGLQPYQCPIYTNVEPIGSLTGERQDFLPLGPFMLAL